MFALSVCAGKTLPQAVNAQVIELSYFTCVPKSRSGSNSKVT